MSQHNESEQSSKMLFLVVEYLAYPLFKLLYLIWYLPMVLIGMCRRKRVCEPLNDPPEVMSIPAVELAKRIAYKEVSCKFVIDAYISRIEEVNPILNAIVEECFETARHEAITLDSKLQSSTKHPEEWLKQFPLLGVPLTVKESIAVVNMSNTSGHVPVKQKRATHDAEIVAACRKAGVIILAVTNTPELCMNWETYNKITGTTCNPYDSRRTSGGSSGGEGALIGAGASLIGLGSDVAGSLRLPAHYCGIFSHKPTACVVSTVGHYPTCGDTERWNSHFALGPMCRYAADLLPIMKIVTKDEFKPIMNFSREVEITKVKIYFLKNNGSVLVSNIDAQQSTAFDFLLDHFKIKYNLQVEPLKKSFLKNTTFPIIHMLAKIQGVTFERSGSIFMEFLKLIFGCSNTTFPKIAYEIIEKYGANMRESTFIQCSQQMDALRNEIESQLGEDGVLIMPVFPRSADFHYTTTPRLFDTVNSMLSNVLGLPVSTCPIGRRSNGLPFGVQVISKRFNDRLSMAVAKEIEKICGGWKMPQNK